MSKPPTKPARKPSTYRLISLEAENIKRLKAVFIEPGRYLVNLAGANEQGKTSVLDALWWLFSSKTKIQLNPIRDNEEHAKIVGDLGAYIITRTFDRDPEDPTGYGYTTKLEMRGEAGEKIANAQEVLNALVGDISFDPLEFKKMKPDKQFEVLKQFATAAGVNFDDLTKQRQELFDKRTDTNRKLGDLEGQIKAISFPDDTPAEPIDESALANELDAAGQHNADVETRKANRERLKADIGSRIATAEEADNMANFRRLEAQKIYERMMKEAADLDARGIALREEASAMDKRIAEAGPLKDRIDTSEILLRMELARTTNAAVAIRTSLGVLTKQADDLSTSSKQMTADLAALDDKKREMIASVKIPVDDIGFGDGFITLKGQPFEQASGSQQLKAAIQIASAANPRLRVLRIVDGSLLDDGNWAILEEMAERLDMQVWIETVGQGHSGSIIIEDGSVKEIVE